MILCRALLPLVLAVAAWSQQVEILGVIQKSAEDWNRGDLEAFLASYEQSPETTFVGTEISRGTAALLERYRRSYPDRERMGKTTFTSLDLDYTRDRQEWQEGPTLDEILESIREPRRK